MWNKGNSKNYKDCLAVFMSVTETEISINHPQALEISGTIILSGVAQAFEISWKL